MAGRLNSTKKHELIVKAANLIKLNKRKIKIYFAGEGPLTSCLKKISRNESIINTVYFNGKLGPNNLKKWFRK